MFFWVNLHRVLKNVAVCHSFPLWLLEPYFLNGVFRLHAIKTEKLSHQLIWYYFGASFNNTASCACFPGSPRCWYFCWSSHKNKEHQNSSRHSFWCKKSILESWSSPNKKKGLSWCFHIESFPYSIGGNAAGWGVPKVGEKTASKTGQEKAPKATCLAKHQWMEHFLQTCNAWLGWYLRCFLLLFLLSALNSSRLSSRARALNMISWESI